MRLLSKITGPAVDFLSASTDLVLRLFGAGPNSDPPITEEEIKMLIEQGTQAGIIDEAEQDMLERVFHLADQRVSELMTPRPEIVWLDLNDPLEDNRQKLLDHNFARFPVCRDSLDEFLGVVDVSDLLTTSLLGEELNLTARVRQPLLVAKNTKALRVLELFKQTGTHIALLIDEYGVIQGLVTLNNILEALVDYIPSLNEVDEQRAVQREDGSWLLDGRLSINNLREIFPDIGYLPGEQTGNYRTMGGFMITHLGRIPGTAEHFEWGGLRFEVVDMDGNRIDKILVAKLLPASEEHHNE